MLAKLCILATLTMTHVLLLQATLALESPANANDVGHLEDPTARWLHLEKAFIRRVVTLTATQETQLSNISIEEAKATRPGNAALAPQDIVSPYVPSSDDLDVKVEIHPENALQTRQIVRRLERLMTNILSNDQKSVYSSEKAAREQFRRQSSALGLALFLDRIVSLSIDQIHSLETSLASWSGVTDVHLEAFESTTTMIPVIRESILAEHLTRSQLDVLASYRRITISEESRDVDPLFNPVLIAR